MGFCWEDGDFALGRMGNTNGEVARRSEGIIYSSILLRHVEGRFCFGKNGKHQWRSSEEKRRDYLFFYFAQTYLLFILLKRVEGEEKQLAQTYLLFILLKRVEGEVAGEVALTSRRDYLFFYFADCRGDYLFFYLFCLDTQRGLFILLFC